MWENLLASWRQSGQKQDPCPSLLNHNAKYKRLLPPYCDFANGVRSFMVGLALRCIWPPCSSRPASPAGQQGWAGTPPGLGAVAQYGAWRRHVVMAPPALDHTTLASSM